MSTDSRIVPELIPLPTAQGVSAAAAPVSGQVGDMRQEFEAITHSTPRNHAAEQAFLASKAHIIRTHPTLAPAARAAALASIAGLPTLDARPHQQPIPGGVGYGLFYEAGFKSNYATGTAIAWDIICPTPPGGNVNTFLYLTATNRTAKGVEAFVSYDGQNQTFFKVFDWARNPAAPWQTNIPFANLGNYVRTDSTHGNTYDVLPVLNVTQQGSPNQWWNQVYLWNHVANHYDLIYQFEYTATLADQQNNWVGSWAPIVETFQNPYMNTSPMGTINTQLISKNAGNQWGAWGLLASSDSYIRTDNVGFHLLFLDPNYTFAVNS